MSSLDQIPETPAMTTQGFSTEEEQHLWMADKGLPANLVKTIHSLQTGLEENANGLLLMHREISSRWLLISDDLKLLQGQQAVLRSQVAAQAASLRDSEGATVNLKEMQEKVSNVLSDLSQAEQRLKDLEAAKSLLKNKAQTLESQVSALQTKEKQLSKQLLATLLLVRDLQASGLSPPLWGQPL
jgi:chromosome segregation ATPase